jgi:hypothetical protein
MIVDNVRTVLIPDIDGLTCAQRTILSLSLSLSLPLRDVRPGMQRRAGVRTASSPTLCGLGIESALGRLRAPACVTEQGLQDIVDAFAFSVLLWSWLLLSISRPRQCAGAGASGTSAI